MLVKMTRFSSTGIALCILQILDFCNAHPQPPVKIGSPHKTIKIYGIVGPGHRNKAPLNFTLDARPDYKDAEITEITASPTGLAEEQVTEAPPVVEEYEQALATLLSTSTVHTTTSTSTVHTTTTVMTTILNTETIVPTTAPVAVEENRKIDDDVADETYTTTEEPTSTERVLKTVFSSPEESTAVTEAEEVLFTTATTTAATETKYTASTTKAALAETEASTEAAIATPPTSSSPPKGAATPAPLKPAIEISRTPAPKTDHEKGMLEAVAFWVNLMTALTADGCTKMNAMGYNDAGIPLHLKHEFFCPLKRQMAESAIEVSHALEAGGLQPLPQCQEYQLPYGREVDLMGFLTTVWWFAGIGRSMLHGSLQVIENNTSLTSLISGLLTHTTRIHTVFMLTAPLDRDNMNPLPQVFDASLHPFLAYQLLTDYGYGCPPIGIPRVPKLYTAGGFRLPSLEFPKKNKPHSVSWEFNWSGNEVTEDLDDGRLLFIAWLGGLNKVTLSEVRRCGEDMQTGWACGRTEMPKGFEGTIAAVLVDNNQTDYSGNMGDLLAYTLAGPAHIVLS